MSIPLLGMAVGFVDIFISRVAITIVQTWQAGDGTWFPERETHASTFKARRKRITSIVVRLFDIMGGTEEVNTVLSLILGVS